MPSVGRGVPAAERRNNRLAMRISIVTGMRYQFGVAPERSRLRPANRQNG